jgi:hypothetical protein
MGGGGTFGARSGFGQKPPPVPRVIVPKLVFAGSERAVITVDTCVRAEFPHAKEVSLVCGKQLLGLSLPVAQSARLIGHSRDMEVLQAPMYVSAPASGRVDLLTACRLRSVVFCPTGADPTVVLCDSSPDIDNVTVVCSSISIKYALCCGCCMCLSTDRCSSAALCMCVAPS